MTRAAVCLARATARLVARTEVLEARLDGDEAAWPAYVEVVRALALLVGQGSPGWRVGEQAPLLTTKQLAEKVGVAPRTLLRWRKQGRIAPAAQTGQRGRAALRWKGTEVVR